MKTVFRFFPFIFNGSFGFLRKVRLSEIGGETVGVDGQTRKLELKANALELNGILVEPKGIEVELNGVMKESFPSH
jgi:hypothetical protein